MEEQPIKSEVIKLAREIIDSRVWPVSFTRTEAIEFVRKIYPKSPKRMTEDKAKELLYEVINPLFFLEEPKRTEAIELARKMYDSGESLKNIAKRLLNIYGVLWTNEDIQYFIGRGTYDEEMKFPYPKFRGEAIEKSERFVYSYYKKREYEGWKIVSSMEEMYIFDRKYEEISNASKIIPMNKLTVEQRKIIRTTKKMLGKPDFVFMKDNQIIFVEVKLGKGTISKKQKEHFKILSQGFDVFVVYVNYTPKLDIPLRKRFSIEKIIKIR